MAEEQIITTVCSIIISLLNLITICIIGFTKDAYTIFLGSIATGTIFFSLLFWYFGWGNVWTNSLLFLFCLGQGITALLLTSLDSELDQKLDDWEKLTLFITGIVSVVISSIALFYFGWRISKADKAISSESSSD